MSCPGKVTWAVRMEPDLKDKLQTIAKAENRSLNNLIETFLSYMCDFYEKAPLYPIDDLLSAYHEATWSDAFGPEYDRDLKRMLADDRKSQQRKLKDARKQS